MGHRAGSAENATDKDDLYRSVLQHEAKQLRQILGPDELYRWRDRLARELGRPGSLYVCALSSPPSAASRIDDTTEYAEFLARWRTLITETLERLQRQQAITVNHTPEDLATAILAAVHGGVLLARVTRNAETLRNALNLPFDQLCPDRPKKGAPQLTS